MQRVVHILYWQWAFLFAAVLVIVTTISPFSLTGMTVLQTEDTTPFAPPYDAFTNEQIITLQQHQIDEDNFEVIVDVGQSTSSIYGNFYYYTITGWQQASFSTEEWTGNSATTTIQEQYTNIPLRAGNDFFIGVWTCKGVSNQWECGCTTPDDCGYWHIQGIDIETTTCVDIDGDGYGSSGEAQCFVNLTDCDDTDAAINPGAIEVPYNGVDDDCNPLTRDEDVDKDGYASAQDCNDNDDTIHPNAVEICEDGIDQNCDGNDQLCEQCGEGSIPYTGCTCAGTALYNDYCCDNSYQVQPCGTPEVIFYDGFESGSGNTWDYVNPNSQVNTDMPQSGMYGLNLIYSSGSSLKQEQFASKQLDAYQQVFHRYFLRFEEDFIQPTTSLSVATIGDESWPISTIVRRYQGDGSKGRLSINIDGNEVVTSKVLDNGQWYCMELEVLADDAGAGNGIVRLWVDNAIVLEQTGITIADGDDITYLKQGGLYGDSIGIPINIYIDNVVVSRQQVGCS